MWSILTVFLLGSANLIQAQLSETTASGTHAPTGPFRRGQLIFEENFNNFNLDVWEHEQTLAGGGNWEFQWYTNNRSNSYTENGILHIAPTLVADEYGENFLTTGTISLHGGQPADQCTNPAYWGCERTGNTVNILNPVKSARLRSIHSFAFKYGIVEVRAKLPAGDWLWPAIWLMPKKNFYGSWPSSGEIDLVEGRGNRNLFNGENVNVGVGEVGSTLHYGPVWNLNGYPYANFLKHSTVGFNEDFHVYRLGWTSNVLEFSVDNEIIGSINITADGDFWTRGRFDEREPGRENPWKRNSKIAPFDQEFYIIMNLAVGGTNGYFPDNLRNEGSEKPWLNTSPQALTDFWNGREGWLPTWNLGVDDSSHLQVDYVRIYAV
ncbi:hypothetical protein PVAND_000907 [Polypedilum vanderplanki]|uniref:GH16 domain-containing protein n=1 Tax=Polypedilum vanderplanki TaxID=319348 RepID=A0A9J6BMI4_POLVA|nr:hypothetical protein PVAND_000907 [Polypedilum vanderplanki]